ncbi:MAG: DinB family protein [Microscillaceae bacterium]|jgi:uncharacterized damage-inducible protein DinB|nr:DinB family protein [Microscillaceae bacterium]
MNPQNLLTIFQRDLKNLQKELQAYPNEAQIWQTAEGISNSAGNLTLHLVGNLNHFIGALLGNTGYVREREREFADKNIPLSVLLENLDKTAQMLAEVLPNLSPEQLAAEFTFRLLDQSWTTEGFLIHLVAHFNYHLGQINYHRRLLNQSSE